MPNLMTLPIMGNLPGKQRVSRIGNTRRPHGREFDDPSVTFREEQG
jgi:hypothetical protein